MNILTYFSKRHKLFLNYVAAPIPMIYYSGELLDLKVIVMEYIEGETPTSFEELDCNVQNKCMESLRWLHSTSRIHGDVRPQNFIVTKDGNVTIIDLGLSRVTNDTHPRQQEMNTLRSICLKTPIRSQDPISIISFFHKKMLSRTNTFSI